MSGMWVETESRGAAVALSPSPVFISGHRDVVGSVNMYPLAFGGKIAFPAQVTYQRAGPLRVRSRNKQPWPVEFQPARCSRPDTGHQEGVVPFTAVFTNREPIPMRLHRGYGLCHFASPSLRQRLKHRSDAAYRGAAPGATWQSGCAPVKMCGIA